MATTYQLAELEADRFGGNDFMDAWRGERTGRVMHVRHDDDPDRQPPEYIGAGTFDGALVVHASRIVRREGDRHEARGDAFDAPSALAYAFDTLKAWREELRT